MDEFHNLGNGNSAHFEARVSPHAKLGKNNVFMEGVIIRAGVEIGDDNFFGPYCIIGDAAEKIDHWHYGGLVIIGHRNRFTKQVTIDSGTNRHTVIGCDVIMLKNAHVGHDAIIGSQVTLSCNVCIGGFCTIGLNTNFGLGAVVHQRIDVPANCMIGMNSTITKRTELNFGRKYAGSPARDIGENKR